MTVRPEIICNELVVEFPLFDSVSRSVKARISGNAKPAQIFRGLDGVSVKIGQGERVGLIGRNGAGKSTFLRTLAGVYAPTFGEVAIKSPTTSLFEVAVGTDPDASGYENIPLLMASHNIPKSKTNEVIEDVESFTELGDALARPLRTYSAGMRLRIAFAVATFEVSDILLMDEVIGVGDKSFREKSKLRISRIMEKAGSLVLASHSNNLLKTHCNRGLVFDKGKIVFDGPIDDSIGYFEKL